MQSLASNGSMMSEMEECGEKKHPPPPSQS